MTTPAEAAAVVTPGDRRWQGCIGMVLAPRATSREVAGMLAGLPATIRRRDFLDDAAERLDRSIAKAEGNARAARLRAERNAAKAAAAARAGTPKIIEQRVENPAEAPEVAADPSAETGGGGEKKVEADPGSPRRARHSQKPRILLSGDARE